MTMHSGWIAALGVASVAFFVATDAQAAPVDNPGAFAWLTEGSGEIVDGSAVLGLADLNTGELASKLDSNGNFGYMNGTWGLRQLADKGGNGIVVPGSGEPLKMAVQIQQQSTGTLNAIPGQEEINLDLVLVLRFDAGGGIWCTTPQFRGRFVHNDYSFDRATGEGRFALSGPTDVIPPVTGCGGYAGFINSTLNLGSSQLVFGKGAGRSVNVGPHGS